MEAKIICTDENYYFRFGISEIIKEAMLSCTSVQFLTGVDRENLQKADLIVVNVSQWRLLMCQPAYRYRKPESILLVFVDSVEDIKSESLPVCYQALTVIARFETVRQAREKITHAWLKAQDAANRAYMPTDCMQCSYARISLVQLQVLSFLRKGKSVRQIAHNMGLSVKTIYAHKYNVMRKFDLKGERELHSFLNDLSLLELYKGIIEDKDI